MCVLVIVTSSRGRHGPSSVRSLVEGLYHHYYTRKLY